MKKFFTGVSMIYLAGVVMGFYITLLIVAGTDRYRIELCWLVAFIAWLIAFILHTRRG